MKYFIRVLRLIRAVYSHKLETFANKSQGGR